MTTGCSASNTAFPVACPVDEEGIMTEGAPGFEGEHVFKVNPKVMAALDVAGKLLASGKLVHSYPHSWRSKAPLIFRNTPQWFIGMEQNDLRAKALKAIEDTEFFPAAGQKRLYSMIADRPDWCVSRQRAWGVPITVFVNKKTGEPLKGPEGAGPHCRGGPRRWCRRLVRCRSRALPGRRLRR